MKYNKLTISELIYMMYTKSNNSASEAKEEYYKRFFPMLNCYANEIIKSDVTILKNRSNNNVNKKIYYDFLIDIILNNESVVDNLLFSERIMFDNLGGTLNFFDFFIKGELDNISLRIENSKKEEKDLLIEARRKLQEINTSKNFTEGFTLEETNIDLYKEFYSRPINPIFSDASKINNVTDVVSRRVSSNILLFSDMYKILQYNIMINDMNRVSIKKNKLVKQLKQRHKVDYHKIIK